MTAHCPECGTPRYTVVAAAIRAERAFQQWWDNQNCSAAHEELTDAMRALRGTIKGEAPNLLLTPIAVLERAVDEIEMGEHADAQAAIQWVILELQKI